MVDFYIIKILILATISFFTAMIATPILTHILYKYKFGKNIRNSGETPLFSEMHAKKAGTPTMGGIIIWATTVLVAVVFYYVDILFPESYIADLNFLTRSQTLLPLGIFVASALIGLLDDIMDIWRWGAQGRGIPFRYKFIIYSAIAIVGALWFYFKLEWDIVHVPFFGDLELGLWFIPFFIFVVVGTAFSVNQTDGLDGLAGGIILIVLFTLGVIAISQGRYDLAAFCGVILGSLLAFLWFNIYPARFFMGDTGAIALGVIIAVIAIFVNSVFILPIIGFVFVWEAVTTIVQIASKKFRGKKVFLSAPWHHHLEAKGWPEPKIVMRLWVITGVFSVLGWLIFLLDKTYA